MLTTSWSRKQPLPHLTRPVSPGEWIAGLRVETHCGCEWPVYHSSPWPQEPNVSTVTSWAVDVLGGNVFGREKSWTVNWPESQPRVANMLKATGISRAANIPRDIILQHVGDATCSLSPWEGPQSQDPSLGHHCSHTWTNCFFNSSRQKYLTSRLLVASISEDIWVTTQPVYMTTGICCRTSSLHSLYWPGGQGTWPQGLVRSSWSQYFECSEDGLQY